LSSTIPDTLNVPADDLKVALSALIQADLIYRVEMGQEVGYLPSLTGYWLGVHEGEQIDNESVCGALFHVITNELASRWESYTRSQNIDDLDVPQNFAVFLLFMLAGGAVGSSHPLAWHKHSGEPAETARALLVGLCEELGQMDAAKRWKKRSELDNFARRSTDLITYLGNTLRRQDDETKMQTHFYFDLKLSAAALVPLVRAAMRSLGAEPVFSVIMKLDMQPWANRDEYRSRARHIDDLFGRYMPDQPYRRALAEAVRLAKQEFEDEMEP
jgi:hypothetical protein